MTRIIASPFARKLAQTRQIDLTHVIGTGPEGRIIARDIENWQADTQSGAAPSAALEAAFQIPPLVDARLFYDAARYDEQPLNDMQKSIAKRLSQAKTILPHFYLTAKIELDALLDLRAKMNAQLDALQSDEKLTVNDFIIRATALALIDEPAVNVSFADDAILQHHHADIGVAVALPGGLITPIIQNAETKSLRNISREVKSLAARAAEKKLKPAEYEGGSFSISNLGMFGIEDFTAIINPPQAAILAVGAGQKQLAKRDGEICEITELRVTLSCDHRAINGAVGAQFLQALKFYSEHPLTLSL